MPELSATGHREKPELPWTCLAQEEFLHGVGVGASQPLLLCHASTSRFSEAEINREAPSHMRPKPAEMIENVRVRAARLLQSIREDSEPPVVQRARRHVPLLVG